MQPERPGDSRGRRRRGRQEAWRLATGQDIEEALRAAERLLMQAEERRRHEQNLMLAIISAIVATTLSLIAALVVVVQLSSIAALFGGGLSFFAAFVVLVYWIRLLQRHRANIASEFMLRLSVKGSSMVNAALIDVAERESWSYLRLESAKLRLSAFPLLDPGRRPSGKTL